MVAQVQAHRKAPDRASQASCGAAEGGAGGRATGMFRGQISERLTDIVVETVSPHGWPSRCGWGLHMFSLWSATMPQQRRAKLLFSLGFRRMYHLLLQQKGMHRLETWGIGLALLY